MQNYFSIVKVNKMKISRTKCFVRYFVHVKIIFSFIKFKISELTGVLHTSEKFKLSIKLD